VEKNADKKVTCKVCGHEAHVLFKHLKEKHKLTVRAYSEKYPGAAVFSDLGSEVFKSKLGGSVSLMVPDREYEMITLEDLMGWSGERALKVKRFLGESPLVPLGSDDGYVYDYDATLALLFGLSRPKRNAVWISGTSGVGKTQLVLNVCRRVNREVIRVNLDSSVTRSDLIGDWVVVGGETRFKYGALAQAMVRGAVLLLDEFDLGNPYVVALFRPVLEDNPRLLILENGGEVIAPHPEFRVVATANTFGAGDESSLYGTTHSLSLADRQRFSLFIQMDYLKPEAEVKLLRDGVPNLDQDEAEAIVQVANRVRNQHKEHRIEEGISPRQLVNFAEVFDASGNAITAANMTFLLPLSASSQIAIRKLIEESGLVRKV